MTKITVIDAICGSGKTSYAIQMMNENPDKKFIFITPYLDQIEPIQERTKRDFPTPTAKSSGGKLDDFERLIRLGKSVITTHSLFGMIDVATQKLIKSQGYTLVLDEVANVVEQAKIIPNDLKILLDAGTIKVNEKNQVVWNEEDYSTRNNKFRFYDIKRLAEKENLYLFNSTAIFWTMDVQSFLAFEEVYILTYLFDGQIQKYYYDMKNVSYEKKSVTFDENDSRYKLVKYDAHHDGREKLAPMIKVFQDIKKGRPILLNTNYDSSGKHERYWLTTSWFNQATESDLKQLNNNLRSYFERNNGELIQPNDCFWTTKKDVAPKLKSRRAKLSLKDNRDKDNYLPLNVRATNKYGHCKACAYVYNRFMNPIEKHFFESFGVKVNEDLLAVSDLVQFLFRGQIRNDKEIKIYLPSLRMRELLEDWSNYKL